MHVLLLAPGASIHSYRLIIALLEAGHQVTQVSREDPCAEKRKGYRYFPYPGIPGLHRLNPYLGARLEPVVRKVQFRRLWRRLQPDVVNVQGLDLRATYCAEAGMRPLVLTCWGADVNDLFDTPWEDAGYRRRLNSLIGIGRFPGEDARRVLDRYKRRIGRALRRADLVNGVTPEILGRCEQLAGGSLRTEIFRFGTDFDVFRSGYEAEARELREHLRIPVQAKVLLSVRTLQPLFGHEEILAAFAELLRSGGLPPLVLVFQEKHSFPHELARLKGMVSELGLAAKVFWLPSYIAPQHLPVQYAMADVVISYPQHDGFPVSLLEAAACRRPIVCSRIEAYESTYGAALIMVPPANASLLAAAILGVLTESQAEQHARVEKAFVTARSIGDQQLNFRLLFQRFGDLAREAPPPRP